MWNGQLNWEKLADGWLVLYYYSVLNFKPDLSKKKWKLGKKKGEKCGFRRTERAGALRRGANFFILLPAVSEEAISSPRNSDTPEIKISKICGVKKKSVGEKKSMEADQCS